MTKRLSPVGRIVQGNPLVENLQTDDNGQPKLGKDGNQQKSWYLNIAIDKQDPDTPVFIGEVYAEAARAFPQLFPQGVNFQAPNFGCVRADFAAKVIDGDGVDNMGQPHARKEGWAGHWIVKVSTYAGQIRTVDGLNGNAPITQVGNGQGMIKTGDYVRVALDFKTNGWNNDPKSKPGLYMNPDLVQLFRYGNPIISGPDANEVFKAPAGYIPAGASLTPTVAALPLPGATSSLPAPMALPGSAGALPPVNAPQPLPAVNAAPKYKLSPEAAAAGHTKEALNAQGHTDESLLANGYLMLDTAPVAAALPTLAATPALPVIAATPALPVIPNHALVAQVLATPQYVVAPAIAAQGHTLESLRAAGHTDAALLQAGYIVAA